MKKIHNHTSYPLSANDMLMVLSVPEGGNWKNIPEHIPSKRLERIRETGGRTTLYGRLSWKKPSYTITTYFNRPGNGAYIHPESHRCISVREAARLQSFPDDYIFLGSKSSQTKQIGNAVPPLFAYKFAKKIKERIGTCNTLDLFCGSGGLTQGFKYAGFNTIAANDNFKGACETYRYNNPDTKLVEGDITTPEVREQILNAIDGKEIDIVMGGPPCQGFSYAGKRLIDDPRNFLYKEFVSVVDQIKPKIFLFENVEGILTSNKGKTLESIIEDFFNIGYVIYAKKMHMVNFGVPQKRKRVILIGAQISLNLNPEIFFPDEDTVDEKDQITVLDAISDLPIIEAGDSRIEMNLAKKPKSDYQRLMRGEISIEQYFRNN